MGHVNKSDDVTKLMKHVTLKDNSPIVFSALWLVTTHGNHVYYWKYLTYLCKTNIKYLMVTSQCKVPHSSIFVNTHYIGLFAAQILFKFQQILSSHASVISYKSFARKAKRLIHYWKALVYHWNVSQQKNLKLMEHGLFREIPWLSNDRKLSCS